MSDTSKPNYEVGYGKPPKASRFKPGQSGNPKGREKGSTNFQTEFERELRTSVTVTEGGKTRKIPKRQAIVKQAVNKAVSGDPKHIATVLAQERQQLSEKAGSAPPSYDTDEDARLVEHLIQRIREAKPPAAVAPDVTEQSCEPDATAAEAPAIEGAVSPTDNEVEGA